MRGSNEYKMKQSFWVPHHALTQLLTYCIASILFMMHFFMIECSFDVIDFFIFFIYDVLYVATTSINYMVFFLHVRVC